MAWMNKERKAELAPGIKAVLKKYKMKGTIAVENYSTLVVNLKEGPIDFSENNNYVNPYWVENHYTGVAKNFLTELLAAMRGNLWYDNSDAMIDYFDTAYYMNVNVGKWNKPYTVVA